ncbi:MAG: pyruvate:ferredoxin (flavodoxin) oxidoreductase [Clostridia bacterium]|nr:pyruvate:ferredoxin (flavodoxin) oxidoreductase [Clostridia bacterium]
MDGNEAAAHVSYAFTDVAAIFPITPSSPMADYTDQWAANGLKNIFGQEVRLVEMQSEGGAAGAVHGSLAAGALTTTYTASQGLLLMIPNMYKIAGELLPCVIHCSARALASHALSIFGDHQDVMACRQTGFAMLASTNLQEAMDLGAVAHLATIKGRVPFLHFFDGFRTSHEIQKIAIWDYEDLKDMVDMDAVKAFRNSALNPEHPVQRGTAQNPDIFFQAKEASNNFYNNLPAIVEEYMGKVNEKIGTNYGLYDYYGAEDAEDVIIAMGSVVDTIEEVIDYKLAQGEKVGLLKVRLFRPFVSSKFVAALPKTVKRIAVLDRTKEPGSMGEPLYQDVVTALATEGVKVDLLVGGRYGLGSKDTPPSNIFAVYENLKSENPKKVFTVGINDDVTNLSLEVKAAPDTAAAGTVSCKFWGLGGDGTVGANKNSIKIIGDHTEKKAQAYFAYDSKKTGGITVSHLRFGDNQIKSPYYISAADFVACHNPSYIGKYDMVQDVKPGGTFLLNTQWTPAEVEANLPNKMKAYIAQNNIQFYTVNAIDLAREIGMGKRTNTILQSAFFKLADIIPIDEALGYMKAAAKKSYSKKGDDVVEMNYKAIDAGVDALVKIDVPAEWANLADDTVAPAVKGNRADLVKFVEEILIPVNAQKGDDLPVSTFVGREDGTFPSGSSAYEKRGVAVDVPAWDAQKCIQCNQCAIVCSHATIRPYALNADEVKNAPAAMATKQMIGKGCEEYQFTMTVSPLDCMGCGVCVGACPVGAITMVAQESQAAQQEVFDYCVENVTEKELPFAVSTVKGSQFKQPLLEFSGACAGCVETAYARLITQLFGDRMYVANATGCSSIWGGSAPAMPYTVNKAGKGPAWANSLFEDNAEYGLGMATAVKQMRLRLKNQLEELIAKAECEDVKAAAQNWIDNMYDAAKCEEAIKVLLPIIEKGVEKGCDLCKAIYENKDFLQKKSVWIFGGDGWAYDIGYGGLDHVLASGEDINVFVFDTEVYSNTGGQASKATQIGQVAQFAAAGKEIAKKDLAAIAMQYGYVYVAQVGMGSNQQQTVKALVEAESYHGPSLVIGYAPCEMHSIKGGMTNSQKEIKKAVEAGYWHLFRFDPRVAAEGKNPFVLDSKAPTASYQEFIKGEARYTRLVGTFPERAERLFNLAEETAKAKYERLAKLAQND